MAMRLIEKTMIELMSLKSISRSALAAALGVSYPQIINVLKGRRRLSIRCSKLLIELFSADLISRAIDWDAMRICNPLGRAL